MEKFRFMSPAWIEMAREEIAKVLAEADLKASTHALRGVHRSAPMTCDARARAQSGSLFG